MAPSAATIRLLPPSPYPHPPSCCGTMRLDAIICDTMRHDATRCKEVANVNIFFDARQRMYATHLLNSYILGNESIDPNL